MPYARKPDTQLKPAYQRRNASKQSSSVQNKALDASEGLGKVIAFKPKEVDMMPGNWAEVGDPTPYELCTTIQTCKRLWSLNKQALGHPDCDHEVTLYNIKALEKLYINLMDYLVE